MDILDGVGDARAGPRQSHKCSERGDGTERREQSWGARLTANSVPSPDQMVAGIQHSFSGLHQRPINRRLLLTGPNPDLDAALTLVNLTLNLTLTYPYIEFHPYPVPDPSRYPALNLNPAPSQTYP